MAYDRLGPAEHLRAALSEMGRLLDEVDWSLFSKCGCGHRQIEHDDSQGRGDHLDGWGRCRHAGCPCREFDDTYVESEADARRRRAAEERARNQAKGYLRGRDDLARKRAERGAA